MTNKELFNLYSLDYLSEIKKIWDRLPQEDKDDASDIIRELNKKGYSKLWIYIAFNKVSKKEGGFFQWKGLFRYPNFIKEVSDIENDVLRYAAEREAQREKNREGMDAYFNKPTINLIVPKQKRKDKRVFIDIDSITE